MTHVERSSRNQRRDTRNADAGRANDRAWQVLLGGGLLLALLYVVAPYGQFAGTLYVFTSLAAAVVIALAVRRHRRRPCCPLGWLLIASALGLAAIGHAIWYWLDLHGLEPFPSLADAFYLAVYPFFIAALWLLGSRHQRDDGALSDALIVGVSAAVLGWALLIAPYLHAPELTMGQVIVSTAYPVADLILLPLILRLLFMHRTCITAHLFLLAGMFAYLIADVLYAHGNLTGWYVPGGITDSFWLMAYALFAAAAWHPSAVLEPSARAMTAELSRQRLVLLGGAALLVPAVILFTAGTEVEIVRVAAIGAILLFLLVLHRMAGLIKQTQRQAEELENQSRTDPLTGAANRRYLDEELAREMARAERTGASLSLAFIDLDYFKQFNDTHGHSAGDALLQELVASWHRVLRPMDVLARVGGEEFVIVFPDTGIDECRDAIERLRGLVPGDQTCSAGIAAFRPGETADDFLDRADQALYAAKRAGRNRVELVQEAASH
jgi:diguanylate cyclase (GGDEF)-like protein